jgi:phospholipid/cholesterol/gamma-HCH transport system ATP-binding protein
MNSIPHETDFKTPAIEFRNVSLSFELTPALRNISFELGRGQMMILTGISRAGKSVLLHLAIGLFEADEGEIFVEGKDIASLDERDMFEIRSLSMGMVFQKDTLFTGMTVYENTAYRLSEHGWSEDSIEPAVKEILRFVGLVQEVDKLPEELSIGMRRRLEIARALIGWPPIMLFDEPTSGLDPINARQVLDLIIRARDIHKITSIYVTKELHEIPYLATHYAVEDEEGQISIVKGEAGYNANVKVMVLEQGRIAFLGSPAEFESSTLPAVTQLTAPTSEIRLGSSYIGDPWSESRKRQAGLLLTGQARE